MNSNSLPFTLDHDTIFPGNCISFSKLKNTVTTCSVFINSSLIRLSKGTRWFIVLMFFQKIQCKSVINLLDTSYQTNWLFTIFSKIFINSLWEKSVYTVYNSVSELSFPGLRISRIAVYHHCSGNLHFVQISSYIFNKNFITLLGVILRTHSRPHPIILLNYVNF